MGGFEGFLLCSDCDGTLTDSGGEISRANREAIRYFQENGGLFTVSTGRFPHYILNYADQVKPNTYVIACNGTVLYSLEENRTVFSLPLREEYRELLEFTLLEMPEIAVVSASGDTGDVFRYRTRPESGEGLFRANKNLGLPLIRTREELLALLEEHRGETVNRLVFAHEGGSVRENIHRLRGRFGSRFELTQSWERGLEAQQPGSGKGDMMLKLKQMLPGVHTAVAVGDNDNDISMLEAADLGVAVSNAESFVKARADLVTVSCDESAIAAVVDYLERNKKRWTSFEK